MAPGEFLTSLQYPRTAITKALRTQHMIHAVGHVGHRAAYHLRKEPSMIALALTPIPIRSYQRLLWLTVGGLLLALLLSALPPIVQREQLLALARPVPAAVAPAAPARSSPAIPTTQQIPAGLAPVLNATLAADDGQSYTALASSSNELRADNPAQRFATTFSTDGISIAPTSSPAWTMRATEIVTAGGSIPIAAVAPISNGARVEYRRDGITEWYVNGPRGLEQGFTLDSAPGGASQFRLALAVAGETPTPDGEAALVIGGLRYGGLSVIDAAGATFPAHLDTAGGTLRIVVDARGAQWPVTVDPTITTARLAADDHTLGDDFGETVAVAAGNGVTTIVVGAPLKTIGTNTHQGEAYVFTGSAGTYTQQARLSSDGAINQFGSGFGSSVGVIVSGGTTTIVVGTEKGRNGQAYIFTGSSGGSTYTRQAILTSPDPQVGDNFGSRVAIATNGTTATIAVAAPSQNSVGAVYLFAGSGSSYPLQTTLTDSSATPNETFGRSLALASSGGTNILVVGAPSKVINGHDGQGQAFI